MIRKEKMVVPGRQEIISYSKVSIPVISKGGGMTTHVSGNVRFIFQPANSISRPIFVPCSPRFYSDEMTQIKVEACCFADPEIEAWYESLREDEVQALIDYCSTWEMNMTPPPQDIFMHEFSPEFLDDVSIDFVS